MLRLVYSGTPPPPPPPGLGWLKVAVVIQAGAGILWLVSLLNGVQRGVLDLTARVALLHVAVWTVYALLMLVCAVFLWRRARWAWLISLGLGGMCVGIGFVGGGSAPIMLGAALLGCLYGGGSAVRGAIQGG